MKYRLIAILCSLLSGSVQASDPVDLTGIRYWHGPDDTRIVLDLSDDVHFRHFTLSNPPRIVLDISNSRLSSRLPEIDDVLSTPLKGMRVGKRGKNGLRLVLDLKARPEQFKTFELPPNAQYGHRVVVELPSLASTAVADEKTVASKQPGVRPAVIREQKPRDIVVAIDAGHGGEDPGAQGYRGTYEKTVVLAIAKRLKKLVDQEAGMQGVLIRDGDYFIKLKNRREKARQHKADLFISIHADAFHKSNARGSSVYVLSAKGASDEASRWLAKRENAADLVGGVSLDDKDDLLASVLLDLSMTGTVDVSTRIANNVLSEIRRVGPVHNKGVKSAQFLVLKSPDIPSMLIETAFISNPHEERRLKSATYQQKLAEAILRGVKSFFKHNPPPGTLLALAQQDQQHVIRKGETLAQIAQQYRVSVGDLVSANKLDSELIRTGQRLLIPLF